MKRMFASLAVATIAAACSGQVVQPVGGANVQGPALPSAAAEHILLRSGETQHLTVGQKFGVALTEHPSVGWTWELAGLPEGVRADGVTDPGFSDGLPGGDIGEKTFRFVAAHPGAATLRFVHVFRGERREEVSYRLIITG